MSLLIIGGVGFLGRVLSERAAGEGLDVCVVARSGSIARRPWLARQLRQLGVRIYAAESIGEELVVNAVRGCGARMVVYTVGRMGAGRGSWEAHVGVWRRVLEALSRVEGVEAAVYVSAASVSPCRRVEGEQEAPPWASHPRDGFTASKAEGERLGLQYYRRLGLPVTIVRPVLMFGPGAPHPEHRLLRLAARLRLLLRLPVDAVPVEDVASAILYLGDWRGARGRWFYVARPEGFTVAELSRALCGERRCLGASRAVTPLALLASMLGAPARLALLGHWVRCGWSFRPWSLIEAGFRGWIRLEDAVKDYASWRGARY